MSNLPEQNLKTNFTFQKFSTARFQKSFKYQVAKMWCSIPTEIKQLTFHNLKLSMIRNYLKAIVNLPHFILSS